MKIVDFPPDTPTTRTKEENNEKEEKLKNRAPHDFSFDCQTNLDTFSLAKGYPIIVLRQADKSKIIKIYLLVLG